MIQINVWRNYEFRSLSILDQMAAQSAFFVYTDSL